MLPGADCWVFGHRVVRWNFQHGDGTNPRHCTFSSDPRTIRDIVSSFELAWNRAIPHAEYKPDRNEPTPRLNARRCMRQGENVVEPVERCGGCAAACRPAATR